jgi:phage N-6-adenine-methyltransferase
MSQAGIRCRNHIQQVRTRQSELFHESGGLDSVDDRRTPVRFFNLLHAAYDFTVDAAASPENTLLHRFWTRDDDALEKSWAGERVWCNPPYSAIPEFIEKADFERRNGCPLSLFLLPADRCEQPWWQDYIEAVRDRGLGVRARFIRKRIKFGLPPDHPDADKGLAGGKRGGGYLYPPFGCVLVLFEPPPANELADVLGGRLARLGHTQPVSEVDDPETAAADEVGSLHDANSNTETVTVNGTEAVTDG